MGYAVFSSIGLAFTALKVFVETGNTEHAMFLMMLSMWAMLFAIYRHIFKGKDNVNSKR